MFFLNQRGSVAFLPLLLVVATLGLVTFLLLSQTAPLKNKFLKQIYPKPRADAANRVANDRFIVKFKPQVTEAGKQSAYKEVAGTVEKKIDKIDTEVIKVDPGTAADAIEKLEQDPKVEFVEPDYKATAAFTPNDQFFPDQWGLTKASFPSGWDRTHGTTSVLVAIVDTGIDPTHPDLASKIVARANFTTDPDNPGNGHGTHVAGIAASATNNTTGVSGSGFDSRLLSVKVLDSTGTGLYSWISQGIIWAADNGAKVINLSLTGTEPSTTLQNAVNYAWSRGVVVVAAAGNDGTNTPIYPGSYPNVISVAATDDLDRRASFSNFGTWVDVAAPGVDILSTFPNNQYAYGDGTSMATPFVSGLAALIFANYPSFNNQQVVNNILSGADRIPGTGVTWSDGRINACKSLECSGVLPTPSPTPIITPSPTPTPGTFGLTFTPSSVSISLAAGTAKQVLSLGSTTATSFSFFGSPTTFGAGINWSPSSGSINPGFNNFPVLISVNNTVPPGSYSGTGILRDNLNQQRTIPVSVVVTTPTPSPSPTRTPTPTPGAILGDISGPNGTPDGRVWTEDYNVLFGNFGKTGTNIPGDFTGPQGGPPDGRVWTEDYNIIVTNFGRSG